MDDAVVLGDDDRQEPGPARAPCECRRQLRGQAQAEPDQAKCIGQRLPTTVVLGARGACHGSDDLTRLQLGGGWQSGVERPFAQAHLRWAVRATSSAWVANRMVMPRSRLSSASSVSTVGAVGRVEVAGRLVGDQQGGLVHERAGERRPLHLAARHSCGSGQPMPDADAGRQRRRAAFRLGRGMPPSRQGSAMLSPSVSVGSRLKNWNTKPMRSRRSRVSASSSSARGRGPRARRARRRPVHGAAQVEQRGLATARRPHQRHEVAGLEGERHTSQRADGGGAAGVGLGPEIRRDEQGHGYIV